MQFHGDLALTFYEGVPGRGWDVVLDATPHQGLAVRHSGLYLRGAWHGSLTKKGRVVVEVATARRLQGPRPLAPAPSWAQPPAATAASATTPGAREAVGGPLQPPPAALCPPWEPEAPATAPGRP